MGIDSRIYLFLPGKEQCHNVQEIVIKNYIFNWSYRRTCSLNIMCKCNAKVVVC